MPFIQDKKPKKKVNLRKSEKIEQIMQKHAQNLVISTRCSKGASLGKAEVAVALEEPFSSAMPTSTADTSVAD